MRNQNIRRQSLRLWGAPPQLGSDTKKGPVQGSRVGGVRCVTGGGALRVWWRQGACSAFVWKWSGAPALKETRKSSPKSATPIWGPKAAWQALRRSMGFKSLVPECYDYFVLSPAGAGLIMLLVCNQNILKKLQNPAGRPDFAIFSRPAPLSFR